MSLQSFFFFFVLIATNADINYLILSLLIWGEFLSHKKFSVDIKKFEN